MKIAALLVLMLAACAAPDRRAIVTDRAPKAIGPYSQAIAAGDLIFVAGQGPIDPATGKYEPGDIRSETKRALENVRAVLEAAGSSLDRVVKVTVYLRDLRDFEAMNEVYASFFKEPYPARATIQAAALPRGFAIEIDAIATR
jgi:2-iminobutanoate/2-iminopropanoate deaminase